MASFEAINLPLEPREKYCASLIKKAKGSAFCILTSKVDGYFLKILYFSTKLF